MAQLSDRLNRLAPSATLAMSQKSSEMKAQGIDVINMSVGREECTLALSALGVCAPRHHDGHGNPRCRSARHLYLRPPPLRRLRSHAPYYLPAAESHQPRQGTQQGVGKYGTQYFHLWTNRFPDHRPGICIGNIMRRKSNDTTSKYGNHGVCGNTDSAKIYRVR